MIKLVQYQCSRQESFCKRAPLKTFYQNTEGNLEWWKLPSKIPWGVFFLVFCNTFLVNLWVYSCKSRKEGHICGNFFMYFWKFPRAAIIWMTWERLLIVNTSCTLSFHWTCLHKDVVASSLFVFNENPFSWYVTLGWCVCITYKK